MEYKVKTATNTTFNATVDTAGPLAVSSSSLNWEDPLTQGLNFEEKDAEEVIVNRLASLSLEPFCNEVNEALDEFDAAYPAIASLAKEHHSFVAKKQRVFAGFRGQLKVLAGALVASAIAITGIGIASNVVNFVNELEVPETCMLQAPPEEGGQCLH